MADRSTVSDLVTIFTIAFAATLFGVVIGRHFPYKTPETPLKPKVDTLYIHDTTRIAAPAPTHSEPDVRTDTLWLHDTVAVPVPIERKTYEDSSYRAVVSGWHPSLDTLDIFQKTTIIEKTIPVPVKTAPRWSLGVTAGYGAGKDGLTPFVGVGVTYNLLSF